MSNRSSHAGLARTTPTRTHHSRPRSPLPLDRTSPRVASHPSPSLQATRTSAAPWVHASHVSAASASTEADTPVATTMAATADPGAKAPTHHLTKPWAPPPRAHHRVPSLPVVSGGGARDRRRSSSSRRREEEEEPRNGLVEDPGAKLVGHPRNKPLRPPNAQAAPLPPLPTPPQHDATPAPTRPWNLRDRKRRPSARAAAAAAAAASAASSPPPPWEPSASPGDRAPFAVALTAEEVEEDIYALTGARPRWRPRKRPRVVQRQLDTLFPGLWLTEITAEAYRVPDE